MIFIRSLWGQEDVKTRKQVLVGGVCLQKKSAENANTQIAEKNEEKKGKTKNPRMLIIFLNNAQ